MRSLLGLSILLAVGCSNACPAPVVCTDPHPDYCPCLVPDGGPVVHPDAFVEPADASADDAAIDAASDVDSSAPDTGGPDAGNDAS